MKKILRDVVLVTILMLSVLIITGCKQNNIQNDGGEKDKKTNGVVEYNAYVLPWRIYNSENLVEEKIIISNIEELHKFCNDLEDKDYTVDRVTSAENLFKQYDEEYFKNKSLAIISVVLADSGSNIKINKAVKDGNSVKVDYEETNDAKNGELVLMVISKGYIVVEVDKDIDNIL